MPNATPTMPNAPERFSGGVTSATYAMPVLTLAAVIPEITRPTKSQARFAVRGLPTCSSPEGLGAKRPADVMSPAYAQQRGVTYGP